jgi:hypothetical protein
VICCLRLGIGRVRVGGPRSMTVARPRVGPPSSAVPPYREVSPLTSWRSPRARPSHGGGGRPRAPNPTPANPHPHGRLNLPREEPSLSGIGPCWVRSRPESRGQQRGQERPRTLGAPAGRSTSSSLTSGGGDRRGGVRVSPPSCREPSGRLPAWRWVTEDGPHPPDELGAVAATCERSSFSPACHRRATSSGHEWYPAVSHGHSETAVVLDAGH